MGGALQMIQQWQEFEHGSIKHAEELCLETLNSWFHTRISHTTAVSFNQNKPLALKSIKLYICIKLFAHSQFWHCL